MQKMPLNVRLDRIAQHIIRARLFLDLWLYFDEQEAESRIFRAMEEFNEFFRFTPHAYLVSYVIYIAGAFDKDNRTIRFDSLIAEVKEGRHLTPEHAATIDTLMLEAHPIVGKVKKLRNGALAHRNASNSYNDVFKKAAVTRDELRDLTEIALKIANLLLLARGCQDQCFTELPKEAAEAMMDALSSRHAQSN